MITRTHILRASVRSLSLNALCVLTVALAWVGLVGLPAQASTLPDGVPSSARSGALGGHGLIGDIGDIYTFPQAALDFTGIGQMNVDRSQLMGSALVVLGGSDNAYAASIHAHDIYRSTIAHLHWARPMDENRLGISLVLGNEGSRVAQDVGNGEFGKYLGWSFGLGVGYSLGRTDLSLEIFGGEMYQQCQNGDLTCEDFSGWDMGIQLNARSLGARTEGMTFGWTAAVSYSEEDKPNNVPVVPRNYRPQFLDVRGGFGPVFRKDGAVAALQGVVGLNRRVFAPYGGGPDQETNERTSTDLLTVPGVELAGEFPVASWLTLRASAGYQFLVTIDEEKATGTVTQTLGAGAPSWAAGAGFHFDNLDLDVVFSDGFTVNGPRFVGGQGSGLASQASLNLSF